MMTHRLALGKAALKEFEAVCLLLEIILAEILSTHTDYKWIQVDVSGDECKHTFHHLNSDDEWEDIGLIMTSRNLKNEVIEITLSFGDPQQVIVQCLTTEQAEVFKSMMTLGMLLNLYQQISANGIPELNAAYQSQYI